jgi:phage shock protein E
MKTNPLSLIRGTAAAIVAAFSITACGGDASVKPGDTIVHHVKAEEAKALIDAKKVVVLDVRTPDEFKAGSIGGAVNIDFKAADFAQRLAALDQGKTYLVHCASGNRSTQSLAVFNRLKFPELYHLDGGFTAWRGAGLPVVK